MTIKHKCTRDRNIVYSENVTTEIVQHKHYDGHAAMNYDCDGWNIWNETIYHVKKCNGCGKEHTLNQKDILK